MCAFLYFFFFFWSSTQPVIGLVLLERSCSRRRTKDWFSHLQHSQMHTFLLKSSILGEFMIIHHIHSSASRIKILDPHCFGLMAGSKEEGKGLRKGREWGQADDPHLSSATFVKGETASHWTTTGVWSCPFPNFAFEGLFHCCCFRFPHLQHAPSLPAPGPIHFPNAGSSDAKGWLAGAKAGHSSHLW